MALACGPVAVLVRNGGQVGVLPVCELVCDPLAKVRRSQELNIVSVGAKMKLVALPGLR